MRWSEFKELVDKKLADNKDAPPDPVLWYIDVTVLADPEFSVVVEKSSNNVLRIFN